MNRSLIPVSESSSNSFPSELPRESKSLTFPALSNGATADGISVASVGRDDRSEIKNKICGLLLNDYCH